jgi:hypothetical protein
MLREPAVEFCLLLWSQDEVCLTLFIGEAIPHVPGLTPRSLAAGESARPPCRVWRTPAGGAGSSAGTPTPTRSHTDVLVPDGGVLEDETSHHLDAAGVLEHVHGHAPVPQ